MRSVVAALVVLLVVAAAPVFAADGNVPDATLSSLGLGGMQVLSDAQGMQVRGMSSSANGSGLLLLSGSLFDPETGSSSLGSFALWGRGTAENAGLNEASDADVSLSDSSGAPNLMAGISGALTTTVNGNPAFDGTFTLGGIGFSSAFGQ